MKCQRYYLPSDNTNWACQTHAGEWGGELWWCCGKTNVKAAGCVRSRHITREEYEKENEQKLMEIDSEEEERKKASEVCFGCKQPGHTIENCTQDPNLKTTFDGKRLIVVQDAVYHEKKYFADSQATTGLLLKKIIASKHKPLPNNFTDS